MSTAKQRVLVVDPDPAIRALIVAIVRRSGHVAEAAGTAEQALDMQRRLKPAAVVVEPRMLGGKALMDELSRADIGTHPVLIVVTTVDTRGKTLWPAASVRAVLEKPFRLEELAAVVEKCCEANH